MKILLATINARYSHASLGLRYIRANLAELKNHSQIIEFTLEDRPNDIVEKLLINSPTIIGFGVYIWNVELTTKVVQLLKHISPQTIVVLGGPEVSYESKEQKICGLADYTICGYADLSFYKLCKNIFYQNPPNQTFSKIINGDELSDEYLGQLELPYLEYSDQDLINRNIYFEASRGCPFKCEFCLSSIDKTAYPFELPKTLTALAGLWDRGLRRYKFVDRTFNINPKISCQIIDFFLSKIPEKFFVHFEMIPDVLPEILKQKIAQFPEGSLQLEVGIQTINPEVQNNISRRQDINKTSTNLNFLQKNTHAHLHTDLIVGLPGENILSFAEGFNWLYNLGVAEIQVGILKRLRGTPIIRHNQVFQMLFSPFAPYELISNSAISFCQMQEMVRFARFWDLIGNSGRFSQSLPYIIANAPFTKFQQLSQGIYTVAQQTQKISLERLFTLMFLVGKNMVSDESKLLGLLGKDYQKTGARGKLEFSPNINQSEVNINKTVTPQRQHQHQGREI